MPADFDSGGLKEVHIFLEKLMKMKATLIAVINALIVIIKSIIAVIIAIAKPLLNFMVEVNNSLKKMPTLILAIAVWN